jgi:transposase
LAFLREQYAGKQLLIHWDGASSHRGNAVHSYLASQNHGTADTTWPLTCFRFAPHAPDQNPIEDVWLKAKTFINRNWQCLNDSFQTTKDLFVVKSPGGVDQLALTQAGSTSTSISSRRMGWLSLTIHRSSPLASAIWVLKARWVNMTSPVNGMPGTARCCTNTGAVAISFSFVSTATWNGTTPWLGA